MRHVFALIAPLAFIGCATTHTPQPAPAYLSAENSCAVIMGGALGDYFGDQEMDEFWFKANSQISEILRSRLYVEKYKVVGLTIQIPDRQNMRQLLAIAAAQNQCNRIIQLTHTIGTAPSGNYFQFEVVVLRLEPAPMSNGGYTSTTAVQIFSKEYRYPRTTSVMNQFHTGEFAEVVLADLKKGGSLEHLR